MKTGKYPRTDYHISRCGFQKGHKINLGKPSPIKGTKWSVENRIKLSKAMKGRICSLETREKIRRAHFGMKPSLETLKKLRESHLGQIGWNTGRKTPKAVIEKIRRTKLGDKLYEQRKKMGLLDCRKVWDKYYPSEFVEIRKEIYKRDCWQCRECYKKCDNSILGKIQCHHIDYNTFNNLHSNLITLCFQCHIKTNGNRNYWKNHFKETLNAQFGRPDLKESGEQSVKFGEALTGNPEPSQRNLEGVETSWRTPEMVKG